MHAHIEPLTGILRVGGVYGQPYTWAVTLRYLSPSSVEALGARAGADVFGMAGGGGPRAESRDSCLYV